MFSKENTTLQRIRNAAMAAVIAASQVQVSRAEQPVPATELQEVVVRTLGRNPVARAENGRTAIEVGFEDKTNDGIHNSPIENSARVVAKRFGLTDAEIEKFIEDLHNKYRNHFIAASRVDGYEFTDTNGVKIKDVHILGNSSGVMGNGSGTAQDVEFKFSSPEQVVRMRYTLPDGRSFDFMVAQTCANPIMTEPGATPTQGPQQGVCKPTRAIEIFKYAVPASSDILYPATKPGEIVPVVTVRGLARSDLWIDQNGDGVPYKKDRRSPVGISLQTGEVFRGISQDQINKDVAALREAGYKGNVVIYKVYDCEGRVLVACWDIRKRTWGVAFPDNRNGDPIPDESGKPHIIATDGNLADYLRNTTAEVIVR